ncbi:FAS1-like dehydratase domain-containing protein [Trujillonella endophytica]|uniref:N-terminal half of MaoC dehydratase n=1 Tax=Trujillonella endophytica TaxID=673521 RepID=A0A1H8WMS6_9ACTN|nr:MaoC family dehydratase N-terminal domain-containing protein [Trujillella endophytica]SEP28737.1 N-terminal half of MaoC dehydratase [Trujillella endophytica]
MTEPRFPVEAGHVLMFRRAIGDPAAVYDPEALAPPTFPVAGAQFEPEHPLRPRPGEPWMGSGRTPSGTAGLDGGESRTSTLHAEQHFTYHRPLRVGDVLTPSRRPGEEWTKEGRRGGTLRFTSYVTEYRDADGELVVTARSVAVATSQAPGAEPGSGEA